MMRARISTAAAMQLLIISFFIATPAFSQTRQPSAKKSAPQKVLREISDKDWSLLAGAMSREDWATSVKLSSEFIKKLGAENEKKQLAQLRYLHLFSLAGNLNSLTVGKNESAARLAEEVLIETAEVYTGQQVVMPSRSFAVSCAGRLNFICPVKDNAKALRVTATNKDADAIISFDYVVFEDDVNLIDLEGRKVFLGGVLDRAEFNDGSEKVWMMRLFLKNGFARISILQ